MTGSDRNVSQRAVLFEMRSVSSSPRKQQAELLNRRRSILNQLYHNDLSSLEVHRSFTSWDLWAVDWITFLCGSSIYHADTSTSF